MPIQDVDFLPLSYRQMQVRRRSTVWRRAAMALFVLLIALGSVGQYRSRLNLERARAKLKESSQRMLSQLDDPAGLQQKIARLDARANLLTFLRIRVPPTRLLFGITNSLPQYVNLSNIDVKFEPLTASPLPAGGLAAPATPQAAPVAPALPQDKDLADLKKTAEAEAVFVAIIGTAPHDNAIARYIAALQRTGLFAEVHLQFTDQLQLNDDVLRRFAMRLKVKQPGREAPATFDPASLPAPVATAPGTHPAGRVRTRPGDTPGNHPALVARRGES